MASAKTGVMEFTPEDFDEAARVLAEVFADYPMLRWLLADAGERYHQQALDIFRMFCLYRIDVGWPCPIVRDAGRIVGVLCAASPAPPPDEPDSSDAETELIYLVGERGLERIERYSELREANLVAGLTSTSPPSVSLPARAAGASAGNSRDTSTTSRQGIRPRPASSSTRRPYTTSRCTSTSATASSPRRPWTTCPRGSCSARMIRVRQTPGKA